MRVLVIGGTGFIGPAAVKELDRMGHRVTVFHRGQSAADLPPSVDQMLGDRGNLAEFTEGFRQVAADVVLDMILSSGPQARALMGTFRGVAGRIVALSSMDVYRACGVLHRREEGPPDPAPLTEDSPLRQNLHPYGPEVMKIVQAMYPWVDDDYDKIPVEREVMSDPELPGTVLRLPMVYGPGDRGRRLSPILKQVDEGRPVIRLEENVARWRGSRGYVENVAHAIALAVCSGRAAGRIYNVAEPEAHTELEWTRMVAEAAGWRGEIEIVPADRAPAELKMPYNLEQHWVADTTRIRQELGYGEPVAVEEALRRTIAWERANPPQPKN